MEKINSQKVKFRLYDFFGSIRYEGDSFSDALRKAKLLPSMMAIYVVDENNKPIAAVWADRSSGIQVTKLESLFPN